MTKVGAPTTTRQPNRRECMLAASAELAAVGDRLEAQLREIHPEVFDRRDRLMQQALTKLRIEQAGGTILTQRDVVGELERTDGLPRTAHA